MIGAQRHPQSCPELAPRFDVTRAAPTPRRAPRGPGTEGPCCGHKVGFFRAKSTPPAQTMSLLWQAQRRGRVEGLAGQDRTLTAGQEVTALSPNAPLWLLGSGGVTMSCPLRGAHGTAWWQLDASGSLCALPHGCHQPCRCHQTGTDTPKAPTGAKPPELGMFTKGKVVACHAGPHVTTVTGRRRPGALRDMSGGGLGW